ncbi:MAG TPA: FAD-binding oxidoreductase [bacterium]|nr:FAD-binding oxidoreductase [bacterium]
MTDQRDNLTHELAAAVGAEHVSARHVDRAIYSRDVWPRNTIRLQSDELPDLPEAVVWPGSVEEVRAVVRIAGRALVPIIPMGAGSGVCGGTVALGGRGIVLDLKRMNRVLAIDDESLTVTAEAGIIGEILERRLNRKGYTMGHFPSSIYCSSFGGWLSTRAAGQLSAKYGKIEDMVVSLQVVLPSGEVLETRRAPQSATGPDWNHAFMGAEGTLGIITAATCRVWPYPASRRFQAYSFATVEDGLEAIREMMQAELRPACVRLYDPVDTFFSKTSKIVPAEEQIEDHQRRAPKQLKDRGTWPRRVLPLLFHPGLMNPLLNRLDRSKLVLTFEGDPEITALEQSLAKGICARCGGRDLGPGPARHWWEKRYKVSYTMQVMFDLGFFVDTIEVATVWDRLDELYYGMRNAIGRHAFVMAHFSHSYPQGCSIYFSIAATARSQAAKLAVYDGVWKDALDECVRRGGSISHHHGVGVLKAKWLEEEEGGALPLLKALKSAVDPEGIMNPGKLGLGGNNGNRKQSDESKKL